VGGVRVGSASSDAGEPAGTRARGGRARPSQLFAPGGLPPCRKMTSRGRARAGGAGGRRRTFPFGFRDGPAAGAYTGDMQALREGGAPARLAPWASPGRCAPRPHGGAFRRKVSISHLCSCLAPATVRGAARLRPPAPRPDELAAPSLTSTRGLCALDIAPEPVARLAAAPSRSPRAAPEARVCQSPANAEQKTASPLRGRAESLDRPTDARIRAVREPPHLGARAKPRPATCTCARPREVPPMPAGGSTTTRVHFFVRQKQKSKKIPPVNGDFRQSDATRSDQVGPGKSRGVWANGLTTGVVDSIAARGNVDSGSLFFCTHLDTRGALFGGRGPRGRIALGSRAGGKRRPLSRGACRFGHPPRARGARRTARWRHRKGEPRPLDPRGAHPTSEKVTRTRSV